VVRTDPALAQSLLSLLNNAADASADAVEMRAYLYGDSVKMEVADRGQGLAPEIAECLGRPFTTSKASRGGMGLGLFLTQSVIARLGGSMNFRPRPESGTCVEVTVPLSLLRAA
jgi:two-component system sensor histidine kinase RegB